MSYCDETWVDPYRGTAVELARKSAPGPGMHMAHTRFCLKGSHNAPQKGGKVRAGMFTCALHFKVKGPAQ